MSVAVDIRALNEGFRNQAYVADEELLTTLVLADALAKPLLIEGEAGVGKTEVAKCLADIHGRRLIRLQCYEGLDAQHALYDWDYQRQLLAIQMAGSADPETLRKTLYSDDFLVKRPMLDAIASEQPVVLLIDEIDRADEEFEALLLELLSDFQISIPELGTFKARTQPHVVLTSNGVRELSDALRRRCLYHYMDYPSADREQQIIKAKLPEIDANLNHQLIGIVQKLRGSAMRKAPGVAETLDWAASLMRLNVTDLHNDAELVLQSLSSLVKTREDRQLINDPDTGIAAMIVGHDVGSSSSNTSDSSASVKESMQPSA